MPLTWRKALVELLWRIFSKVKIPNSPAEFIKGCLDRAFDDLGDDSHVTIETAQLKRIMDGYWEAMELVADQQKLIDAFTDDV